jgi:multiple sugar transport system substrate-binding protein
MNKSIDTRKFDVLLMALGLIVLAAGIILTLTTKKINSHKNTTLVFTQWWQEEMEAGTLPALAAEFEALNPGITIQLNYRPYTEILRALRSNDDTALKSDVLGLDPLWFEEQALRDLLEPLDTYDAAAPAQGYAAWGRPVISFTSHLFYNIELLQSAGFDRPPGNRTEMLAYARAVTDTSAGRYALALALSPENPRNVYRDIFSWIWTSGVIRETKPDFSAPAITGALTFLKQLRQEDCILPGTFSKTDAEKREDFINGRSAMMIASVADIHTLRERMGENAAGQSPFGLTLVPGESSLGGKPILGLTSWYLGIPRSAVYKDEAWAFLSFLLERSTLIAEKAHAVPGSRSSVTDFITDDPLYAKAYDIYTAGDTVEEFTGIPRVDEFETMVREQIYALFEEGQSPEETAKNIQRYWEEL